MFPQAMNVRDLDKGGNEYFIWGCPESGFTCMMIILTRVDREVLEAGGSSNGGQRRNVRQENITGLFVFFFIKRE